MATITGTIQTTSVQGGVPFTPYRMALVITGVAVNDVIVVWRSIAGVRTTVRGGNIVASATSEGLVDWEMPFGVAITYGLTINGVDDDTDGPFTVNLVGGTTILTDAINGLSAFVNWARLPKLRDHAATLFNAQGRNIVVHGGRGQWQGQVLVETTSSGEFTALDALLSGASQGICQVRQNGAAPSLDDYFAMLVDQELRVNQGTDIPARQWPIDAAQVDGWAPESVSFQEIVNLAADPAAKANGTLDGQLTWSPLFYGTGGSGNTTLQTGTGPLPWLSSWIRKSWTVAPSGNGDTGFVHSQGWSASSIIAFPVVPGEVYTISSYLKSSVGSKNASIDVFWHTATGTQNLDAGSTTALTAGNWIRLSRTVTVPAGKYFMTPASNIAAGGTNWANGNTLDGTGLLVMAGSVLHQYGDGDTAGFVWDGTPNQSSSRGWELPL